MLGAALLLVLEATKLLPRRRRGFHQCYTDGYIECFFNYLLHMSDA